MKKSVIMSLLVIIIIVSPSIIGRYSAQLNTTAINTNCIDDEHPVILQENNENVSYPPIIKISLSNGTVYNFTSIDNATKTLYNWIRENKLNFVEIQNISMYHIRRYAELMKNATNITIEMEPSYKFFFIKTDSPQEFNYTGSIIPVNESEALLSSEKITKSLLYGRIGLPTLKDLNGQIYDSNFFSARKFTLFVFFNSSMESAIIQQLIDLNTTLSKFQNHNVAVFAIDINNNSTLTTYLLSKNNISLNVALDKDISLENLTTSGIYKLLGFEKAVPAAVLLDNKGFLIRKTLGYESSKVTLQYIDILEENYPLSLAFYPIMDVYLEKAIEGVYSDIVVVLGEGFGSIKNVTISYRYTFVNDTESDESTIILETSDSVVFRKTIHIPNDTKEISVDVEVYSEYGNTHTSASINIKQIEEKKGGEAIPIELEMAIILIIIVIVFGAYYYRKIGK